MKIGIITFHHTQNFGGCLQALALQEYLKTRYHVETGLINYCPDVITDVYRGFSIPKYIRMLKKGYGGRVVRVFASDLFYFKQNLRISRKFNQFYRKYYNLIGPQMLTLDALRKQKLQAETLIAGSDQIWNKNLLGGLDCAYFLKFGDIGTRRIAFSASIGQDELSRDKVEEYRRMLQDFDYISTREKRAQELLQNVAPCPIYHTLDPTLMLTSDQWLKLFSQGIDIPKEPYIFLYTINWSERVVEYAQQLSEKKGIPLVTVLAKQRFENELGHFPECTPDDFVRLISGAQFVVTNSFHGTVFSILFGKSFWTFLNKDRNSRIVGILETLGIENRIVAAHQAANPDETHICYDDVYKKLTELRLYSSQYLDMAVGIIGKGIG